MKRSCFNPQHVSVFICALFILSLPLNADDLVPGKVQKIYFPELPATLYTMMNGIETTPCLTVRLPGDYDPSINYPLLVYVPGNDGGVSGNIGNARAIAGDRSWIVASLPLFKKSIDHAEPAGGIIVSLEDYPQISFAYKTMLGELFEHVPNIDPDRSAMVGFSNGALTIGTLISLHDEFTLTHFKSFCLVDHGMFHLTDLHKKWSHDRRFLILVGDQLDQGRALKIRGAQLLQDAYRSLGVDVSSRILPNTGHEFREHHMELVGQWLNGESLDQLEVMEISVE